MPGSLWAPFREGNRSEYLAQYFLSALGVSVSVPRPEDIGIDFYCALAREASERLTFHSPFAVQVGSYGTKDFAYGGLSKSKKGKKPNWQKEQLEWLFTQELPLFLATVDKENVSFRLYSTSPIWLTRYTFGDVTEVRLIPDATHDPLREVRKVVKKFSGHGGDGCSYDIPLGAPVVELSIDQLRTDMVGKARASLAKAAYVEMRNLTYRRLHVHFSQWMLDILSNDDSSGIKLGQFYAWNAQPGKNTSEQLEALLPIIIALAHNLKAQKRMDELQKLKGVFDLIPQEAIPGFVRSNLPELYE